MKERSVCIFKMRGEKGRVRVIREEDIEQNDL